MAAILLFLLFLSLTGCSHVQSPVESTISQDTSPAYFLSLTAGEVVGSAILFQQDESWLYVLTASHVVSGMALDEKITLRFFDGWEIACSNISFSEVADLAMIQIPAEEIPAEHRKLYPCVEWDKESFDKLQKGDKCIAIGQSEANGYIRHQGNILESWIYMEDYGQYMLWADVTVEPGMSGGGLLDEKGRLIGILSGGSEDGELAAVPLSLVLQFTIDLTSSRQ